MWKCAVAMGFGLGLVIGAPAEAAKKFCEAIVAERLDSLNVDSSDIRKIHYLAAHATNRDGGRKTGYEAWVSLRSCKGNLVVKMSLRCKIREVYGHGDCELGD